MFVILPKYIDLFQLSFFHFILLFCTIMCCHGSRTNNLPSVHKAQVGRSYDMQPSYCKCTCTRTLKAARIHDNNKECQGHIKDVPGSMPRTKHSLISTELFLSLSVSSGYTDEFPE